MKRNNIAIKLINVSKKYTIHHEKPTLAEKLFNGKYEDYWALRNINLDISQGMRIGLIGANGSGKTTLLKLIAGISHQTTGKVEVYGKIVSLIDLEAGFHPDLTGAQNIYLNGMLLGMKRSELDRKLSCIIDFADIGKFIDVPLFTYSEGMKLRLGFSVAIHSDPDILLLDENISVGDRDFSEKAWAWINRFAKSKKTLIFASHHLDMIKAFCNRIVLLEKGTIIKSGSYNAVVDKYLKSIGKN